MNTHFTRIQFVKTKILFYAFAFLSEIFSSLSLNFRCARSNFTLRKTKNYFRVIFQAWITRSSSSTRGTDLTARCRWRRGSGRPCRRPGSASSSPVSQTSSASTLQSSLPIPMSRSSVSTLALRSWSTLYSRFENEIILKIDCKNISRSHSSRLVWQYRADLRNKNAVVSPSVLCRRSRDINHVCV